MSAMWSRNRTWGSFLFAALALECGGEQDLSPSGVEHAVTTAARWAELSASKPKLSDAYARFPTRREVTSTIVITRAGTYDYSGILHIWKGPAGGCEQKENGPQILRIEADNVTIKNFAFRGDGQAGSATLGDPIHITTCGKGQGNECPRSGPRSVVLDGIVGHACEDLITAASPGGDNITIQNSVLFANPDTRYRDKTVQFNFGQNFLLRNNVFVDGERCTRFKPNTSGRLEGNTFWDCKNPSRISSDDADIAPMRNGPVTVRLKNNVFRGCSTAITRGGSQAKVIDEGGNQYGCSKGF